LNEDMEERVVSKREVSSRVMWVKLKMGTELWVVIGVYAPGGERSVEERILFFDMVGECVRSFVGGEKIVVLGDMNARVGDERIEGILGAYGMPGKNEGGEHLIDMCVNNRLMIGNTWFKKRRIHK
jgi:hypothetical protein